MEIIPTNFEGLFEIVPVLYNDSRGYFLESFRAKTLIESGLAGNFVQDNQSYSVKNVVRGLHLQMSPHEQVKLVRAVSGKVLDIALDLRKGSPTFGEFYKCILDGKKNNMLYIPEGFAHGFAVLENAHFSYKCSSYYHRESEEGILFNDKSLNIDWEVDEPIVSKKDTLLNTFEDFVKKYDLA